MKSLKVDLMKSLGLPLETSENSNSKLQNYEKPQKQKLCLINLDFEFSESETYSIADSLVPLGDMRINFQSRIHKKYGQMTFKTIKSEATNVFFDENEDKMIQKTLFSSFPQQDFPVYNSKKSCLEVVTKEEKANKQQQDDTISIKNALQQIPATTDSSPIKSDCPTEKEESSDQENDSEIDDSIKDSKLILSRHRHKLKTNFMKDLFQILSVLLTNKNQNVEYPELTNEQHKIIAAVAIRKAKNTLSEIEQNSIRLDQDFLIKSLQQPTKKRPEEAHKHLFTRILKYLKKFISSKTKTPINEQELYIYYFQKISDELDMDIREFYYPFKKGGLKGARLNKAYFEKLKLSSDFVQDCKLFIENYFYALHVTEIQRKLISLFKPFDIELSKNPGCEADVVFRLVEYIENHPRCKLPWTLSETEGTLAWFRKLIVEF